jgi:DNA-binding MarR family transcriptional regulator
MPRSASRTTSAAPAPPAPKRATIAAKTAAAKAAPKWTFLTNHSHVLIVLAQEPELVLREVAQRVGITERAVQRIIHELEEGGVLERTRVGRRNRYSVVAQRALRHPIEAHRTVADLLRLGTLKGSRKA